MKAVFEVFHVLGAVISTKMSGSLRSHLHWVIALFVLTLAACALLSEAG